LSLTGTNLAGGTIFAPNATVIFGGSYLTTTGFIEAQQVDIQGDHFTLIGNGPLLNGTAGALTE
jgi:hypothetical protein